MANLRKYLFKYDAKRFIIQKAFHLDDEEWCSKSFAKALDDLAGREGIDIFNGEDVAGWYDESPREPNPKKVWHVVFHGHSQQEYDISKKKGADEDEAQDDAQVFVAFYFRLKDGMLYKIETEQANG